MRTGAARKRAQMQQEELLPAAAEASRACAGSQAVRQLLEARAEELASTLGRAIVGWARAAWAQSVSAQSGCREELPAV